MPSYVALLRKDPDSDYGVDFPDFPGCVTAGSTLAEAYRMAHEALRLHMEVMADHSEPIPDPTALDKIMAEPVSADAIPFLVHVEP